MADGLVYIYDGTFDGLLNCIYNSYDRKEIPGMVAEEKNLQIFFGQMLYYVKTEEDLARRVERGIIKKAGSLVMETAAKAFFSHKAGKETHIFEYIRLALKHGTSILNMLTHPDVLEVGNMIVHLNRELELLLGFARFSKMKNGVFFSRITPKNNVVAYMMPHFVDRYSVQPFIIYDPVHETAGVYDMESWYMVETKELNLPPVTDEEANWIELWQRFYTAIAIKDRINPKLRQNHCPKRYWENMPEMPVNIYG